MIPIIGILFKTKLNYITPYLQFGAGFVNKRVLLRSLDHFDLQECKFEFVLVILSLIVAHGGQNCLKNKFEIVARRGQKRGDILHIAATPHRNSGQIYSLLPHAAFFQFRSNLLTWVRKILCPAGYLARSRNVVLCVFPPHNAF